MDNHLTNESTSRILIISLQGIGDAILITPLISSLRKNIKNIEISVLTFRQNSGVLAGNKDIDELICIDRKDTNNLFRIVSLIKELRRKKFKISICAYPGGLRTAFLSYLSGARERLGQDLSIFKKYRQLFTELAPISEIKHAVFLENAQVLSESFSRPR
jgi:ADP-heptose:LPS heptosyltransferase